MQTVYVVTVSFYENWEMRGDDAEVFDDEAYDAVMGVYGTPEETADNVEAFLAAYEPREDDEDPADPIDSVSVHKVELGARMQVSDRTYVKLLDDRDAILKTIGELA